MPWIYCGRKGGTTLHTFKNRSGATVRVRNVHRPAARFEDYIEHINRLARARGIKGAKDPRLPKGAIRRGVA